MFLEIHATFLASALPVQHAELRRRDGNERRDGNATHRHMNMLSPSRQYHVRVRLGLTASTNSARSKCAVTQAAPLTVSTWPPQLPRTPPRLLWCLAMTPQANFTSLAGQQSFTMLRIAVLSARKNAPSLAAHMIYLGPHDQVTNWLERHGVVVHFRTLRSVHATRGIS